MDVYSINPYIRLTKRHMIVNWNVNTRIIFDYELIMCEGGRCTLRYDGLDYQITRGTVVLICPGIEHKFYNTSNFIQPHIHFDLNYDDLSEHIYICFEKEAELAPKSRELIRDNLFYRRGERHSPIISVPGEDLGEFTDLFNSVIDSFDSDYLKSKADMIKLLDIIEKNNFPGSFRRMGYSSPICTGIKKFIDDNLARNVKLEELERHFHYSRYFLEQLFRETYGLPIIEYHRIRRMELARLTHSKYNVTETAERMGFNSVYAFSRAFKNRFGISPLNHKKNLSSNPDKP